MATRLWLTGILLVLVFRSVTCAEIQPLKVPSSSSSAVCPLASVVESILQFPDLCWDPNWLSNGAFGGNFVSVMEGDEISLQKALNLVHRNSHDYVSVLFYASWCPFSRTCRPAFNVLSSLYPSIRHFAVEESAIRPSILSRYGVHGFPTLFLLNSTMRVRYHGSRTLSSFVAFYTDVTGTKPVSVHKMSTGKRGNPSNLAEVEYSEQESCPFSWARSPENMLRQESYLALATTFVLLRFLYFLYPTLLACAQYIWRRHIHNTNLICLWKPPLAYLNQAVQVFNVLKEPCKRSNLQGGAMNARVWASKSLASVSIGDASSSRGYSGNER
ncbi:5'-adenylylsulfate reductase-like 4 [Macadamia integrifolia]|uniref:5'-adenylylsulfate reductase-like 4 n=1 Tax=Macadamia integrifolia TaxID=60698 RepID=UPI001C4E96C5|nr:5'-adenylylsulfate reductase-like 4 [Macadamia integrifolia]